MTILNENLEWHQIVADEPHHPGDSFREDPIKKLLQPGQMLCRFITRELREGGSRGTKVLIKGNAIFHSEWWMDWDVTFAMLHQFKAAKITPSEIVRSKLAVTLTMSRKLDGLAQIVLTKPVYAWKGIARYQDDKTRSVTYIGGGEQYYLPHLAPDENSLSSDVAHLHCFTSADSLM
jgi:hypothetical protein